MRTGNRESAVERVHEVDLIGIEQMRSYYSASMIWCERFGGLVKSLVAIKAR
jgi:hypothetical protein